MTWISKISGIAYAVLPAAASAGEAKNVLLDLYGRIRLAAETIATGSIRTEEINPLDQRYTPGKVVHTNIPADATTSDYIDMAGARKAAFQLDFAAALGVGVTFWITEQDDGTVAASCAYVNKGVEFFGAASFNADDVFVIDTDIPIKYIKINYDNTGGAATEDVTLYYRLLW
jgi:hypothetical protein